MRERREEGGGGEGRQGEVERERERLTTTATPMYHNKNYRDEGWLFLILLFCFLLSTKEVK